jgi:hypothetical protein
MKTLNQNDLKKLLSYDPETGVFTWRVPRQNIRVGAEAGSVNTKRCGKKYREIQLFGKLYLAHRLAWLYVYGEFPPDEIDHIDGNGLNNKLDNLRAVTCAENNKNLRMNKRNTSGYPGVSWKKAAQKWEAYISINGKLKHLGLFENIDDAAAAYQSAAKSLGFHENHGQDRPL